MGVQYAMKKMSQKGNVSMVRLYWKMKLLKERMLVPLQNEEGVGLVEIALIILVIIGLAMIFKEKVTDLLDEIFQNATYQNLIGEVSN